VGKKLIRHGPHDVVEIQFGERVARVRARNRGGRIETLIEAPSDVAITIRKSNVPQVPITLLTSDPTEG